MAQRQPVDIEPNVITTAIPTIDIVGRRRDVRIDGKVEKSDVAGTEFIRIQPLQNLLPQHLDNLVITVGCGCFGRPPQPDRAKSSK